MVKYFRRVFYSKILEVPKNNYKFLCPINGKIFSQSVLFYEFCSRKGFIKRIFENFDDSADG